MANRLPLVLNPLGPQEQLRSADNIVLQAAPADDNHAVNKAYVDNGHLVISVNGQTGVVVLDASDVGALPDDTDLTGSQTLDQVTTQGNDSTNDITLGTTQIILDATDGDGTFVGDVAAANFYGNGSTLSNLPVTSVNDMTGDVVIDVDNINAQPRIVISEDAPRDAKNGDLYWDTQEANLYIYYKEGTNSFWVPATPAAAEMTNIDGGTY